jgi:endonuclease YncB( thermonuclease family)
MGNSMKIIAGFGLCFNNPNYKNAKYFLPEITKGIVVKVYDGDTITVISKPKNVKGYYKFSVRLAGIDTAEMHTNCTVEKEKAEQSKQILYEQIYNKTVYLKNVKREKYGRILANVYLDKLHINQYMLDKGGAIPYTGKQKLHDWSIDENQ